MPQQETQETNMLASHKTIKVLAIIYLLLIVQQALNSYCVSFPGDCTSSPSYNKESVNQNDKQPLLGHEISESLKLVIPHY